MYPAIRFQKSCFFQADTNVRDEYSLLRGIRLIFVQYRTLIPENFRANCNFLSAAKNIHPGHLYLPEKNSSSENEAPDTKLLFGSQAQYGFLKIIASVLADQLIASMEKTKQNAVKKNDGRSIARTIAFLEGSDCAESGPEPARKLKKILKFILSYAPECADKLNADPLLALFISKENLLP